MAQIHFGGRIGLNMPSLSTQPKLVDSSYTGVSDFSPKLALNIAAIGYFEIGPYFAIQPEILYNRKGLKSRIDIMRQDTIRVLGNWNYSFDYIEIPLLLKFSIKNDDFDPFLELGGYYGWMFNATCTEEATYGGKDILDNEFSLSKNPELFNTTEMGIKIGIGATVQITQGKLFFSVRYSQGFKNALNNTQDIDDKYNTTYNRVFQITIGYLFEVRSNTKDKIYYY